MVSVDYIEQVTNQAHIATVTAEFDALCAQAGLRVEQVRHSAIADISYLRCARA